MNQQCGNCKWWDKEYQFMSGSINNPFNRAKCKVVLPNCVEKSKIMFENEGQNCLVYEERKE